MPEERISKVLAAAGVASRRGADALIAAGRVTVDGRPVQLGEKVDPERQQLAVDGRPIAVSGDVKVYLALHKPVGVTSTVKDRHAERTVIDLVPRDLVRGARVYPVGRLDQDSEGLILLTNDGEWAERVLHPRYGVEREYAVGLAWPLTREQAEALERGVQLIEGIATLQGLRGQTRTEDRLLADIIEPTPDAAPHVGPGHHPPGLEAAAATDVRRGGCPGAATRAGAHRHASSRDDGVGRCPLARAGRGPPPGGSPSTP